MRGQTARALRKKVFGHGKQATVDKRRYGRVKGTGQIINIGLRAQYQLAKRGA